MGQINNVSVDLGGLIEVLGGALYSQPQIFLRELVQNAHDAITRRNLDGDAVTGCIVVSVEQGKDGNVLIIIEDNGSGLTREEIVRDLATIGRGVTGQIRKSQGDEDGDAKLIGAFGLGFLSSYLVADHVRFITTSYKTPDETWCFTSSGGSSYSVAESDAAQPVGTRLELTLKFDFQHFSDYEILWQVLERHCLLLRHPIYVGSAEEHNQVNATNPVWRDEDQSKPWVRWTAEAREWVTEHEEGIAPLAVLKLGGSEGSKVRGLLWLHDYASSANSDLRSAKVYIRNMLVARNARELLPFWAGFVSGIIEADDLTPTASRETLQEDEAFETVQEQIERDLIAGLSELANADSRTPQAAVWQQIVARHNQSLLSACIASPELMQVLETSLRLSTSLGDMTLPNLLERSGDEKILISSGRSGVDRMLARVQGRPVVDGKLAGHRGFLENTSLIEVHQILALETSNHAKLFSAAEASPELEQLIRSKLISEGEKLSFVNFEPNALPLLRLHDEYAMAREEIAQDVEQRRIGLGAIRLAQNLLQEKAPDYNSILYVNLANPIWDIASELEPSKQEALLYAIRIVADLLDDRLAVSRAEDGGLEASLDRFVHSITVLTQDGKTI